MRRPGVLAGALQFGYWWFARRVCPVVRVEFVDFIDARTDQRPPTTELVSIVREALVRITSAGNDYRRLVEGNLRLVGALGRDRTGVWIGAMGYVSGFGDAERNPQYLASRLVWAAEYLREVTGSDRRIVGTTVSARESAQSVQLEFVRHFADSDRWVDYIKRHGL